MGDILVGDVRDVLRTLKADSVHCVVTSPPYWSLRSYSTHPQVWGGDDACNGCPDFDDGRHQWIDGTDICEVCGVAYDDRHDFAPEPTAEGYTGKRKWQHSSNGRGEAQPEHKTLRDPVTRKMQPEAWSQVTRGDTCRHCGAWRGELGGEPTPELYVEHIVEVFREVRRVLRKDGTCWVNLGDSYIANPTRPDRPMGIRVGKDAQGTRTAFNANRGRPAGLKPKDLVGIPWRAAFALQADGWYLRQDIIWAKPSAMPESVQDRCTKSHEYLFLLAKSHRYYFDPIAIAEPVAGYERKGGTATYTADGFTTNGVGSRSLHQMSATGRNKRSVWTINTEPTSIQHFATYPEKLVEPCILAGTSEKGVCRQCGAPWRRVTDTTYQRHRVAINRTAPREHSSYIASRGEVLNKHVETTGWQPSCKHPGDPIPATVLDIFLGSGTTARVAERLGRNWIGVELNENYAAIARRRTAQRGLMQWGAAAGGAE